MQYEILVLGSDFMMREPRDRTAEGKTADDRLEIERSDFCDAFEQDPDRLFSARECWYCKYGDFGILTEHPTQKGVCRRKKQEEEKK
jgi:hypothetical protein